MQTFLISNKFEETANILDNKRLGKQILECSQILKIYLRKLNILEDGKKGYINHPVTNIWQDIEGNVYLFQLLKYTDCMYEEWKKRYGIRPKWEITRQEILDFLNSHTTLIGHPKAILYWSDEFYELMKRNLIRKNPLIYSPLFPNLLETQGYLYEHCKTIL